MSEERLTRDQYFMSLAELTGNRSKDPHTKVGSCIVKDNHILSLGYNGAPRDFPDEEVPWNRDTTLPLEEQKYPYICHSELNAILNYRGDLSNLKGSTIYVTVSPCYDCAKALAQVGVSEVIYKEKYHRTDISNITETIFKKCGINYHKIGEQNEIKDKGI